MQRMTEQRGSALLLLMGITAALAILTATTVMMLANQQGATADERQQKTSVYYADAALNGAVKRSENKMISQTSTDPWVTQDEMLANVVAAFGGTLPAGVSATCVTYDNLTPVNQGVKYDSNNDGRMWVEVTVAYQGKTTRMRVLVVQTTKSVVARFPKAALFSDGNINLSGGSGDIYAVNDDGTPYIPSPPGNYATTIMAGGNFAGNSSTDLAAPGSSTQSVGIKVNGSVSPSGRYGGVTKGGVPSLSDYFNQADQANLMFEAKSGTPTQANASATVYTTKAALLGACSYNAVTKTYTASTDLVWKPPNNQSGNSTLTLSDAGTTYNFKSLYIMPYDSTHAANLTLGGTTHTNTTALYVGGNFTVNGPTGLQQFGPTYVVGTATWTGPSSGTPLKVQTTDYADASAPAGPLYVGIIETSGLYNHVIGDTWAVGIAGTGTEAVGFRGPSSGTHSTIMCPLLGTTEKIVTSGLVDFGTLADPMTLYMCCDNDGLYTNTMEWGSTGTFYGLMAVMEAQFTGTGGNTGTPNIVGAVFCVKDITFTGNTSIAYNQAVIENIKSTAITTTTTKTDVVPGTWQQLSASGT